MPMGVSDPLGSGDRPAAKGFDRVRWRSADGTETTWTRAQFEGLGLVERVRLLAGGELRFFKDDAEVSARSALSRD